MKKDAGHQQKKRKRTRKSNIERAVVRSVITKIPTATAWIFSLLFEMGAATIDIFLSPSYYGYHKPQGGFIDFSDWNKKRKKIKEITIRQSIRRLRRHGFVEKNNGQYRLTLKGKNLAQRLLEAKNMINKKWDGKYRVVIFDIPEEKSGHRNWLREELYLLEYKLLQKSVFIGKHPLPKNLIKIIKRKKIGNYVNYILAEEVYKNIV